MLDVLTVPRNSPVAVVIGGYEYHHGRLRDAFGGHILVDTDTGTYKVNPDNPRVQVMFEGRVLGFVEPDPVLPTTPPDLE